MSLPLVVSELVYAWLEGGGAIFYEILGKALTVRVLLIVYKTVEGWNFTKKQDQKNFEISGIFFREKCTVHCAPY